MFKKVLQSIRWQKHEGQTKLVGKNRHDKNKKQTQSDRKQNITSATIWRKWNKALKQCKQRYYEKIFFHTFWSKTTTDWMWDMPLSNERWGLNVGRHDKTSISVNNIKERGTTVETHAQCSVLMSKKTNKSFSWCHWSKWQDKKWQLNVESSRIFQFDDISIVLKHAYYLKVSLVKPRSLTMTLFTKNKLRKRNRYEFWKMKVVE